AHLPRVVGLPTPKGVDQALAALFATPTGAVATMDADAHRGRPTTRRMQLVAREAATPPAREDAGPARSLGVIRLASLDRHGHEERVARRLQIADDVDRIKTAVQQQQLRSDARRTGAAQQALEDVGQV